VADGIAILLTCSGASNVGQISHQAVVELAQEGFGKFFLLGRNRSAFGKIRPIGQK
jgi:uncharacterized metal-binding protein